MDRWERERLERLCVAAFIDANVSIEAKDFAKRAVGPHEVNRPYVIDQTVLRKPIAYRDIGIKHSRFVSGLYPTE